MTPPRPHQSTNNELASAIAALSGKLDHNGEIETATVLALLAAEVKALREELRPLVDVYQGVTVTAQIFKWGVGICAGLAAVATAAWAAFYGLPK